MISGKEEFFNLVDEGRKGANIGFSIGSGKLETYMDGLLPGTGYLIGGASGSSKSTYMLWAFIYQPLIHFMAGESTNRDPYWLTFNLEMTRTQIYAKLVSMYIFDNFGVELKFKKIFSRGKDCILSDDEYHILEKCKDFLDILDERIETWEGSLNEKKYRETIERWLKRFGHFEENRYIPNNPEQLLTVTLDHISLVRANGRSKKEEMDAISADSVRYRNICKILSTVTVSQFNRSANSDERIKQNMQSPSSNDFKDTGATYEDSNVVLAIFSPHKYQMSSFKGYDIKTLRQNFIAIYLLKSRFGTSDIMVPMNFLGDCSHYVELPRPENIYDYNKYLDANYLLEKTDENTKNEDGNIKHKFTF